MSLSRSTYRIFPIFVALLTVSSPLVWGGLQDFVVDEPDIRDMPPSSHSSSSTTSSTQQRHPDVIRTEFNEDGSCSYTLRVPSPGSCSCNCRDEFESFMVDYESRIRYIEDRLHQLTVRESSETDPLRSNQYSSLFFDEPVDDDEHDLEFEIKRTLAKTDPVRAKDAPTTTIVSDIDASTTTTVPTKDASTKTTVSDIDASATITVPAKKAFTTTQNPIQQTVTPQRTASNGDVASNTEKYNILEDAQETDGSFTTTITPRDENQQNQTPEPVDILRYPQFRRWRFHTKTDVSNTGPSIVHPLISGWSGRAEVHPPGENPEQDREVNSGQLDPMDTIGSVKFFEELPSVPSNDPANVDTRAEPQSIGFNVVSAAQTSSDDSRASHNIVLEEVGERTELNGVEAIHSPADLLYVQPEDTDQVVEMEQTPVPRQMPPGFVSGMGETSGYTGELNKPLWKRLEHLHTTQSESGGNKRERPVGLARDPTCNRDGCGCINLKGATQSGIYYVPNPPLSGKRGVLVDVYCDLVTETGAWTVIQRRVNGSANFYRNWNHYARGFGYLDSDFWIGNRMLHAMTRRYSYEIMLEFTDWDGKIGYAKYDRFIVGPEEDNFRLTLGALVLANRGNAFSYHNNSEFSTYDRDNDRSTGQCAVLRQSGFWFKNCNKINPNGRWVPFADATGLNGATITWGTWTNHLYTYSMKDFKMMIRPTSIADHS